ncbi:MAG: PilZ domain-containing protein [Phycisphaerae bacterium]|nr:PilZ domain-containing protein [Phycisphaerae bacterium]
MGTTAITKGQSARTETRSESAVKSGAAPRDLSPPMDPPANSPKHGTHRGEATAARPGGPAASSPATATPPPDIAEGLSNRRAHRRYPFEVRIQVRILEGRGWAERPREVPAEALDVSQGGLSFVHEEPVAVGVRVVVDVTSAASRRKLYGVVRNCVCLRDHAYRVGVQFVTRAIPAPSRAGRNRAW